ncbi:NAD(P)H-dependent glycerol-3-phosphate dehydrogenase [Spiroplasma turonicum]|uniref:Glycerol-3-phosphate dehydrogenase [NAD(P)+] n=1 Tax=Spiroplasma turonicum TaxID=216946 RepID=A0A0K1P743_9MOLU|nr:NAD(P)H-dependent glycerol-3-phosphate dehydrogenase [Spiroplasma turonicum]AKU80105.1 NAD(P)H-dependent glycerol-3-phosphate dehydrogenase [Spiroplasma turonicum]ALX71105.1 NAD(P)H-dependent glycerol-3-phosphate dehydrogenase [Spiroplasma turonicum]
MKNKNITIVGTGAYGTVLANVLTDNGHNVIMYGIEESQVNDINENHINSAFFRDFIINDNIKATNDFAIAIEKAEIVVLSVPTFALDSALDNIIKYAKNPISIINIAKGLDEDKLDLLSNKIFNKLKNTNILKNLGALYGPSVAIEVILRKPTCVMACSKDIEFANIVSDLFNNEYFIVKSTTDIAGCEVASALKNVIAIASGILQGYSASDNARASLITIGNAEIFEFAKIFGAKLETFMNFATLGDLILTCSSFKSRNFSLGIAIAEKNSALSALKYHKKTVEGVSASKIAYSLIEKHKINAPLFEIMYKILYNNLNPSILINNFFKYAKVV